MLLIACGTSCQLPCFGHFLLSCQFDPFGPFLLPAQEYTLLNSLTKWPLGWPKGGYPAGQGPYYCSVGAGKSIGRDIPEVHYR